MANAVFKLRMNSAGAIALLKSPGVASNLAARGADIQSALPTGNGEEWKTASFIGHDRAQTIVGTDNYAAMRTAADTLALQRALNAGR